MNTIDNWLTTAKVDDPERQAFWLSTLGTDTVPILSIIPEWATLPRIGLTLAYLLDIHALSEKQQEKLLVALAEKFQISADEARELFYRDGVPILADDVEVTTTDPALIAAIVDEGTDWESAYPDGFGPADDPHDPYEMEWDEEDSIY